MFFHLVRKDECIALSTFLCSPAAFLFLVGRRRWSVQSVCVQQPIGAIFFVTIAAADADVGTAAAAIYK